MEMESKQLLEDISSFGNDFEKQFSEKFGHELDDISRAGGEPEGACAIPELASISKCL